MTENIEAVRKTIYALENFDQITAFNESRDISGKLWGGEWRSHAHEVFEVRILFKLTPDGEADYSNIEDIHITPPFQTHAGADKSEFKRMCSILIGEDKLICGECDKPQKVFSPPEENGKNKIDQTEFLFPYAALTNYYLNNEHDPEYLRMILLLIFSLFSKWIKLSSNTTLQPADAIAVYIRSHYSRNDLSVSEIAEKYGYSPNYIQKLFKAKWNCTPIEYLKQTRLNAARLLLQQKRWQISEVAAMCGFAYVNYFSKCYRRRFGIMPSEEK